MRALEADRVRAKVRSRLFQSPDVPLTVGRYEVLARVGEGGMGTVYRARDPQLQRDVALKLLHPEHGGERLLEEARVMAKLEHPNVLPVHDVGTFDGHVFLVMKFVDGQTLGAWLREAPRSRADVVRVFTAAARGLAAAHRAGIVHRDFKPDNVLLTRDGDVRVADFGLAREAPEVAPASPQLGSLTQSRTLVVGTPVYMAPELLEGGRATPLSDQFAFCVALFEALHGQRPFTGSNVVQLRGAHARGPPDLNAPAWLKTLVLKGLASQPGERHPSMEAVAQQLERGPGSRRGLVAAAAIVVAAAVGSAAFALRAAPVVVEPMPAPAPVVVPQPRPEPAPQPRPEPAPRPRPEPPAPAPHPTAARSWHDAFDEARAAILAVRYQEACDFHGEFNITVRFSNDGSVETAAFSPYHFVTKYNRTTPEQRACLEDAFRKIRIAPFRRGPDEANGMTVQLP